MAGHDADLDFVRRDEAGAVRAEQQRFLAAGSDLCADLAAQLEHVAHRDAFGNTNRQVEIGFNGFPDRRGSAGRWHVDDGNGGTGLLRRFLDRTVDRDAEDRLAGLLWIDAGDEAILTVGVFLAFLGVELAGLAGDALGDDLGVLVDQNRHVGSLT